MAKIEWDVDASDAGNVLQSPRPSPADRFWDFTTDVEIVGPRRTALGDDSQHAFPFTTRYVARFAIRHLQPSSQANMLELKLWLMNGGEVTVTTDDADENVYEGLTLKPGTTPTIELEDENRQHWKFSCELRSSSPILMDYTA